MATSELRLIRLKATGLLRPRRMESALHWLPRNVVMPLGTETSGQPFSLSDFPHVAGVIDAFDNPAIRTIALQWASRLGKTTVCLALMAFVAGIYPRNMMLASPSQAAVARVVKGRLYPILESTAGVKHQLINAAHRSNLYVKLAHCAIYCGWSGSETSLADVGAFFGVGNEIDKWVSVKEEGDSLGLFLNRFKGFPDHKIILESTPTIKGKSRIEKKMQDSNQHRRVAPCPHCGEFQELVAGHEGVAGGIKWERLHDGSSDPEIAFQTAYYECRYCEQRIFNHHRRKMIRAGVWLPEGCAIGTDGVITGRARREGSDAVGFGPLASWWALTETWGSFARLWINSRGNPKQRQDITNGYKGETWELRKQTITAGGVGKRLASDTPRGIVPREGRLLTLTVDRQAGVQGEGGYVIWAVLSHGINEAAHVVDYGRMDNLQQVWDGPAKRSYPHRDGGPNMMVSAVAIDSGFDAKTTYDFCLAHEGVLPIKGSGMDLRGLPYRLAELKETRFEGYEGMDVFWVNTDFWEYDLQERLERREAGEAGTLTICEGADRDAEFLEQLVNGQLADKRDRRGNQTTLWVKRREDFPNDFRDVIRYGCCLAYAVVELDGGYPERKAKSDVKEAVS